MAADLDLLVEGGGPVRKHIIGVIIGRVADRCEHPPGERLDRDAVRDPEHRGVGPPQQRAVAREGELAAHHALRTLVDHTAHGRRIAGVTHPVKHDLRHRALAVDGLAGGLIVNRLGEAFDRAGAIVAVGMEDELARRVVDPLRERKRLVGRDRLLDGQRLERIGLLERFRQRDGFCRACRLSICAHEIKGASDQPAKQQQAGERCRPDRGRKPTARPERVESGPLELH